MIWEKDAEFFYEGGCLQAYPDSEYRGRTVGQGNDWFWYDIGHVHKVKEVEEIKLSEYNFELGMFIAKASRFRIHTYDGDMFDPDCGYALCCRPISELKVNPIK